jgi:hypothetical protein
MFTKLLVAVDLSPRNEDVFAAGLDLAKKTGASLILLHLPSSDAPECPTLPTMLGPDYYPSTGTASVIEIYEKLWRAYEEKGLEMLNYFAEKARQAGVAVEYTQNPGAPGKTICHLANNVIFSRKWPSPMRRDSIFHALFQRSPSLLFELLETAPDLAAGYRFESVAVKEPAFTIDGVFLPPESAGPGTVFFSEVQMQQDERLYERLFSESMAYFYRNRDYYSDW